MEVEGISFRAYLKLRDGLKKVPGVKEVNVQFNNKIANCSIQSTEKAESLAEAILKALEPEGVPLEITDVSANTIKAKYKGTD
jgi:copper chaperone CopZ